MADNEDHAGLTAEEIEALKDEGDEGGAGGEGEDEAAKAAAEAKAKEEADAKAAAESAAAAGGEGDTGPTEVAAPLRAKAPEKADEALAAIRAEEEELATKFDDGEITAKEFRDSLNKIGERREELRWNQRKAELATEMTQTAKENAWHETVRDFMTTTAKAITDKGEKVLLAFDQYVKEVTADPANQKLSDRAQLEKAHKLFLADFGPAFGGKTETPAPKPGEKEAAATGKRSIVAPPTLAKVPAAEVEDTDGGKYAALDRLATTDPLAYEKAIAKMSEAEQREYLRAS